VGNVAHGSNEANVVAGGAGSEPPLPVGVRCATGIVIGNVVSDNGSNGFQDPRRASGFGHNQFHHNAAGSLSRTDGGIKIETNICGGDTIYP
jgi:hypothetical protein